MLESHIFVEQKRDGKIEAQKVKFKRFHHGRVRSTKPKHHVISVGKKTNKAVTKKSKVNDKSRITITGSKR
jgi:hypothetical protein